MLRKLKEIPLEAFKKHHDIRTSWQVSLYADLENFDSIYNVINNDPNKFSRALYEIVNGRYNDDLYGKEKISKSTQNITAIKFKKTLNQRIYCKEYFEEKMPNIKRVVMLGAYQKRELDKKLKTIIEKLAEYEYEF